MRFRDWLRSIMRRRQVEEEKPKPKPDIHITIEAKRITPTHSVTYANWQSTRFTRPVWQYMTTLLKLERYSSIAEYDVKGDHDYGIVYVGWFPRTEKNKCPSPRTWKTPPVKVWNNCRVIVDIESKQIWVK